MPDVPTRLDDGSLTIRREPYATLPDGRVVDRWAFGSEGAVMAEVLSLGARLQALYAPDRDGHRANIVLGGASVADMLGEAKYFGATVGRYANRIAGGELPVEGAVHRLRTQGNGHTLHGGPEGFDARICSGRTKGRPLISERTASDLRKRWSGRQDLNLRPLDPQRQAHNQDMWRYLRAENVHQCACRAPACSGTGPQPVVTPRRHLGGSDGASGPSTPGLPARSPSRAQSSPCVQGYVNHFLVDGRLPAGTRSCPAEAAGE
ncbi:hypothetical protein [Streptomyces sp. NBC_00162]|uniref:aldose epimerase family protein n=1 Tax=Streptomyces sp. NBC_00162 TaxID=2903629 RepID=UPI00214BCA06|nr:hypothetical protein [Streptomyces sp. NBC_00162]UUU38968.1 hypothetical protein JIW86_09335 [Streptomyces sp. NBC_00162]